MTVVAVAWNGPQRYHRQLPRRPRTTSVTAASPPSYSRAVRGGATQRQTSTPSGVTTRNQDRRTAYERSHYTATLPSRSSSALPFTESAVDVPPSFHSPPPAAPTQAPSKSAPGTSQKSAPSPQLDRRSYTGQSPKPSLVRKLGNWIRRSKSANSSREPSPLPSPSLSYSQYSTSTIDSKSSRESEDWRDWKDWKRTSPKKKSLTLFRKRRVTKEEMMMSSMPVSAADSQVSASDGSASPVIQTTPDVKLTLSNARGRHVPTSAPSTPAKTGPGSPQGSVSRSTGTTETERAATVSRPRPRLQLPATPDPKSRDVRDLDLDKSNTVVRPLQLKIQLSPAEQAIVAKRYVDQSAVPEAVADINELVSSSLHPSKTTSGDDVTSASGDDLTVDSGIDGGYGMDHGGPRPLVDGSFRRTELIPTVRRFTATCQLLSATATTADRAAEFNASLADSVHAFVAVLAVSRRANYGPRERDQLTQSLRQVAESYCSAVTAAGLAVGLSTDQTEVLEASRQAAYFAKRLSSLLMTLKYLKAAGRTERPIAYF